MQAHEVIIVIVIAVSVGFFFGRATGFADGWNSLLKDMRQVSEKARQKRGNDDTRR